METRANYVVIGLCTVLGILAGLGFFVWLAKWQSDRQYAYYDILFDNVAGLSRAASVSFSGLNVGEVASLELANDGSGRVRTRIQIDADTPIREGTVAQLQAQGVTGVSAVSLTPPSTPDAPLLTDQNGVPEIPAQRSVVQSLTEDAPNLLQEAIKLVKEFQNLVGGENQTRVSDILNNVANASGELETALTDFSKISQSVASATDQIAVFTDKLDPIAVSFGTALDEAEGTLASITSAFTQGTTTLATADTTLKTVDAAAAGAGGIIRDQGVAAMTELQATITELRSAVNAITTEAKTVLAGYGGTATLANARLAELQTTVSELNTAIRGATTTLASVDTAATSVSTLVGGDGTQLVADARTTLASLDRSIAAIEKATTDDVPAVMSEIRTALASVNTTIDKVSGEIIGFTGDLRPLAGQASATLTAATTTFETANRTLDSLEPTIAAAEATFKSASEVVGTDLSPAAADLRASANRLTTAIEQISADIPQLTSELTQTVQRANSTVAQVDTIVRRSSQPVQDFATQGLPQFTRFTQQASDLITRLDRIAGQLERDPARFLLGNQAPNFRR